MTFKQKIRKALSQQGRKHQWLADQMEMHRKTLWLKMKDRKLSAEEKGRVLSILGIEKKEK